MKIIAYLISSCFFFLFIFDPPFAHGFSFSFLFIIISFFICLKYRKDLALILRDRDIVKILRVFFSFALYYIIVSFINYLRFGKDLIIVNLRGFIFTSLFLFSISFSIFIILKRKGFVSNFLCDSLIGAGIIQTVIGFSCLANSSVKNYFNSLVVLNSSSELVQNATELSSSFRNFGFASNTFDMFGMVMSIMSMLAIKKAMEGFRFFFIIAFFMSIIAVVNARSSFVLIVVGSIIFYLSNSRNAVRYKSIIFKILVIISLSILLLGIISNLLDNVASEQLLWMSMAFEEFKYMASGEEVGYFDVLLNNFIIFPSDAFSILFGVGLEPIDFINQGSDIGYIKCLWLYGLIGSLLYFWYYYTLIKSAKKNSLWPNSIFFNVLLTLISIYMVKLTCLGYCMASLLFVPLCFFAILSNKISLK